MTCACMILTKTSVGQTSHSVSSTEDIGGGTDACTIDAAECGKALPSHPSEWKEQQLPLSMRTDDHTQPRASRTSRSTKSFCTTWFQQRHTTRNACSGCADSTCKQATTEAPYAGDAPPVDSLASDDCSEADTASCCASSTEEDPDNMSAHLPYPIPVTLIGGQAVERDLLMQCSEQLTHYLRERPTLPAHTDDYEVLPFPWLWVCE